LSGFRAIIAFVGFKRF